MKTTQASGTAEHQAAEGMIEHTVPPGATFGGGNDDEHEDFIDRLIVSADKANVVRKTKGGAVEGGTARDKGYATIL